MRALVVVFIVSEIILVEVKVEVVIVIARANSKTSSNRCRRGCCSNQAAMVPVTVVVVGPIAQLLSQEQKQLWQDVVTGNIFK